MRNAWARMGKFWFSKSPNRLKRLCILAYLQSVLVTGVESFWPTEKDYKVMDSHMARLLRAMFKGKACWEEEEHRKALTNAEVLHYWDIMPARWEVASRRVAWIRDMVNGRNNMR